LRDSRAPPFLSPPLRLAQLRTIVPHKEGSNTGEFLLEVYGYIGQLHKVVAAVGLPYAAANANGGGATVSATGKRSRDASPNSDDDDRSSPAASGGTASRRETARALPPLKKRALAGRKSAASPVPAAPVSSAEEDVHV